MAEVTADAENCSAEERTNCKSTSMICRKKLIIIGANFWSENAKKNPMFLKKKSKILWRGNRSLTQFSTLKIHSKTLLASMGKLYPLVSFSHLLAVALGHRPLIPPPVPFCKTAKRLSRRRRNKNKITDEQFCNFLTVRKF